MALTRNRSLYFAKQGIKHDGVESEVIKRPYNAFKVSTITSQTDFEDARRSGSGVGSGDADDFWNGYYLICVSASDVPRGEARKVTDFVNTDGGVVIESAFSQNVLTGDIFRFGKFVNANSIDFSPELNEIVRVTLGKGLGPSLPVTLPQGATASVEFHVTGVKSYPAVNVEIDNPPQGDLYAAAMGKVIKSKPTVVGTASTSTLVKVSEQANIAVGSAIAVEDANLNDPNGIKDEARWVVGKTIQAGDDDLHVKPAFTNSPTSGKRVYASATFGLVDIDHPRVTLEIHEPDTSSTGFETIITNCLCNLSFSADVSDLLVANLTFQGSTIVINSMGANHHGRGISKSILNEEPSFGPIQAVEGQIAFRTAPTAAQSGTTYSASLRDITNFAFDLGNTTSKKQSMNSTSGVVSTFISAREPSLSITGYLEGSFDDINDIINSVVKDLQIQLAGDIESGGTLRRSMFVIRVPYARVSTASKGDADGIVTLQFDLKPAVDQSEGFEDADLGTIHNSPVVSDEVRFAIF